MHRVSAASSKPNKETGDSFMKFPKMISTERAS